MREITTHRPQTESETLDGGLTLQAVDDPGPGGASHAYSILWRNDLNALRRANVNFQKGPRNEVVNGRKTGINGISNEVLLAIVADRLTAFQAGSFACTQNADALTHVTAALEALKARTLDRIARQVEGQDKP